MSQLTGTRQEAKVKYRDRYYEKYSTYTKSKNDVLFDYDAAERWARGIDWHYRRLLPERRDAAILECACGRGGMLSYLGKLGHTKIEGIDASTEQVEIARQVCPRVEQGNALELLAKRQPGTCDLILALDFIEHLTKGEVLAFLELSDAALTARGRVILQTPTRFSAPRPATSIFPTRRVSVPRVSRPSCGCLGLARWAWWNSARRQWARKVWPDTPRGKW